MEKRLIKRGTNWELYQNGSLIASTFDTDLPTITFSNEVAKELGIVDVEKLAVLNNPNIQIYKKDSGLPKSIYISSHKNYKDGYNQCLSDNADKKFTLEDVKKAIELASGERLIDKENQINSIIQSLTKEEYFCDELEMEEKRGKCPNCEGYGVTAETVCGYCNGKGTVFVDYQPKITNNSIKVVKIWKTN